MTKDRYERYHPIKYDLIFHMLLVIIPILVALSVVDYMRAKSEIHSNYIHHREQAEKAILHAVKMAESAYDLYSKTLDERMRRSFGIFLQAYKEAGRDPSKMDLESLKQELGGKMDLYIIDENHVVRYSTYETDIGLAFENYPEFRQYLDEIRKGDSFATQRISTEVRTGQLRKFTYMPTPDHKYVLELGLISDEFTEIVQELNYNEIAREMVADYPYLSRVRVFDVNGYVIGNPELEVKPEIREIIQEVVKERKSREISDEESIDVEYIYVELEEGHYQSESTRVIELAFNTGLIGKELQKKKISHFAISAVAIIGGILLTFSVSARISKPINRIIKGIDRIARGDLDLDIEVKTDNELKILEHSINIMVHTIKDNMQKIKSYSEKLEEMVDARTAKLEEANEQLETFVYSVTHDLRAPLRKMMEQAETLLDEHSERLNDQGRQRARKIYSSSKRMDNLIMDLLAYSRLSRAEIELSLVDMGFVLEEVLSQLENQVKETDADIVVEGLLPQVKGHRATLVTVLSNLVSNAIKFVKEGEKPRIRIWGEEKEDRALINVEDNGIGIDPQYFDKIFTVFERLHSADAYPGTGIGLAIVKKAIKKMGGSVSVDSTPGKGSRFTITLPRA